MDNFELEVQDDVIGVELPDFVLEKRGIEDALVTRKPNLVEVSKDIFEEKNFSKGDILLLDNDDTLIPTIKNRSSIIKWACKGLPEDSQELLQKAREREISVAIVTDALQEGHYLEEHGLPIFGYKSKSQNHILKHWECIFSWCNGTYYKKSEESLKEVRDWILNVKNGGRGRVAVVGNSDRDISFGRRLNQKLQKVGINNGFSIYRLPYIRWSY
jgi:hypothetical protein